MFSTESSRVYSQWQGNNTRTDLPGAETITHNTNAQWLVDLRADHNDPPEQELITITLADIQDRVSGMKSWTAC